jgi:hypothetical protein
VKRLEMKNIELERLNSRAWGSRPRGASGPKLSYSLWAKLTGFGPCYAVCPDQDHRDWLVGAQMRWTRGGT